MGKTKAAPDVGELVRQALLKIATADGPVRLSGKGDHPAVFAKANKEAIARLKESDRPLVTESGSGKTLTVGLTPAGFEAVIESIPEEKIGRLAAQLATPLPAGERVAFLQEVVRRSPLATADLPSILEAAIAEEKAEAEARAAAATKRREAEAASLAALERWKAALEVRRKQRVETLRRELAAEGAGPGETDQEPPVSRKPLPKPADEEEVGFRRQVARRLVSSWLEAIRLGKPEARRFLEVAIGNIDGLEQIGEEKQRVPFNGVYHQCATGISTGTPAVVVRPGWKLIEDGGEYIIEQALVTP